MVFQPRRGLDLFVQVFKSIAVYGIMHQIFEATYDIFCLVHVVLALVFRRPFGRIATQHTSSHVFGNAARGCCKRLPSANCALVITLTQFCLCQPLDQRLDLVGPPTFGKVSYGGVAQSKLIEHVLQQRARRLHAISFPERVAILVDGGGVFEGFDFGVDLVVDQDVEQGVRLRGRERFRCRHGCVG